MQEQILGYWVMMATQGGELQRWGHPDCDEAPIDSEDRALSLAARVASMSTCDSVYVMTVYDNGGLSMRTICRPARDPSRPMGDAQCPLDGHGYATGHTGMAGHRPAGDARRPAHGHGYDAGYTGMAGR